ncbi:hypothetical protein [Clostridium brassicae]|uniref:DUF4264 domain-containing protein n=1 Tax=Clostridium brassicae TaxID=2999072 RepID=A0ABT4DAB8_9CLOT|nr:hypothetical protein [Clostridium brassicae]MCY6959264.1 hypothetical protein [Clostridium brassicae]
MSKENIKVKFYYGDESFDKLIKKIILKKLSAYFFEENMNKICYGKDNSTTIIYQEKNKR